jgi:hypothetical protein
MTDMLSYKERYELTMKLRYKEFTIEDKMEALLQSISRIEWALQRIQPHSSDVEFAVSSLGETGVEEKIEVIADRMFHLELEIERLTRKSMPADSESEAEYNLETDY